MRQKAGESDATTRKGVLGIDTAVVGRTWTNTDDMQTTYIYWLSLRLAQDQG